MDTLRLVEVTTEGDLVLMTGDGRRFSLSVDEQVRSAVRRSRNGTHITPGPDRPGPREVQSRIRAGADAEQVAQQTGLDVDYVRRFEGPVLAERAHVAELAQATAVDRGGDPTLTLERVVLDVLTGEGLDVDDISWDSRRSDGTRWEVVVVTVAGATRTQATWSFDTTTRSLEPVDAEAERLTGVERRRRLSAVRDTVFDVERPAAAAPRGGTVDLLDALARQRGRRPVPATPAPGTDADERQERVAVGDDRTDRADHRTGRTGHEAADAAAGPVGAGPVDAAAPADAAQDTDEDRAQGGAQDDERAQDEQARRTGSPAEGDHGDHAGAGADLVDTDRAADRAADRPEADGPDVARLEGSRPDETRGDGASSVEPDLLSELDLDRSAPPRSTPARAAVASAGDRRSRRARRSAVPSWDEIVFGAKREDG